MADVTITFANKLNVSLQVGDIMFYTAVQADTPFNKNTGTTYKMGPVKQINDIGDGTFTVVVDKDDTVASPTTSDYIYFIKDSRANRSGVSGYYAEVKLTNNKTSKAELFSVGSEISESSK